MYRTLLITEGPFNNALYKKLEAAAFAGVEAIQLRAKEGQEGFYEFAQALRTLTYLHGNLLFINERIDIALATHADGVHLPENSLTPSVVKELSSTLLVGVSVHSLKGAVLAQQQGADYIHFGPIFETGSKMQAQGLIKLAEVARGVNIPTIAVGGITPIRTYNCLDAGAFGVAAISAFLQTEETSDAVAAFRRCFKPKRVKISGLQVIVNHLSLAKAALHGGAELIQWRHKGPYSMAVLQEVKEAAACCQRAGVPFLINDRIDIALACQADGVHLGQGDLPLVAARRHLGPKKIIGATASNLKEAQAAVLQGADYIGVGHIFPTPSKEKRGKPLGLKSLQAIRKQIEIPLFAIGGINESNAKGVLESGVDGISVISAICQAKDPMLATQKMRLCFPSK